MSALDTAKSLVRQLEEHAPEGAPAVFINFSVTSTIPVALSHKTASDKYGARTHITIGTWPTCISIQLGVTEDAALASVESFASTLLQLCQDARQAAADKALAAQGVG